VGLRIEDQQARVWVQDSGPGIPSEELPNIWERFHQVLGIHEQKGSVGAGLGLGLYICRELIQRQGGKIGVESSPGNGSCFWFTLPVLPDSI
jgi:signal transduction histidine kinase